MTIHRKNLFIILAIFLFWFIPEITHAQVTRGATILKDNLPKGLRELDIKDYFVESPFKRVGIIHALSGTVIITHNASKDAFFGREGDTIYENDTLDTLSDSRCRIKFIQEDIITMGSNTNFTVENVLFEKKDNKKKSLFSSLKGKVMFYTVKLLSLKETSTEVKTPTAVVGVRGTKFGTHVYYKEDLATSRGSIQIADNSGNSGFYLAQIEVGDPGVSITDCFSEDGFLDVNGKSIAPGQMYNGETGTVMPTPPEYVRSFESETEVKKDETGTGQEGKNEGTKEGDKSGTDQSEASDDESESDETPDIVILTESGTDPTGTSDYTEISSETTQSQTTVPSENIEDGKIDGAYSGVAAMIANGPNGIAYFSQGVTGGKGPIYEYGPNPFYGGAETHYAYEQMNSYEDDQNPKYKMEMKEVSDTNMDMKVTYFDWGFGSNIALTSPHTFRWNSGGRYFDEKGHEYMSWGWWEDTSRDFGLIAIDGNSNKYYTASGKVWEVEGEKTHPDYISYLEEKKFTATYIGEVKGVYANSSASNVVILSGSLSFDVNFGNRQISALNIDINNPNAEIHMNNGSGTIDSNGEFDIQSFQTATINGSAADHADAGGMFTGYKAEGAGGNWGVQRDYEWAVGEFHAKR